MSENDLTQLGNLFLALSDRTRLRLIRLMADGEVSVGYLAESIGESQPKVSRHLAYLRNAGLVATERTGKNVFYTIDWPSDGTSLAVLEVVTGRNVPNAYNTSAEPYMNDYIPQEIEIHLL